MTSTHASVAPSEIGGAPPPRVIERRRRLPGGRAVTGGLLMAIAAIGVFVAYADATSAPSVDVVVATRALRIGEMVTADDLRVVQGDLPDAVRRTAFEDPSELIGRVVLGPIGADEVIHGASLTDDRAAAPVHEVAVTLPRDQIAVGRLKPGERVDVFVTTDERTASVVRGAQVVQIADDGDGSLTSAREITLVVAVPTGDAVAALVHALRSGDVTVVRSTLDQASTSDELVYTDPGDGEDEPDG